MDRGAVDSMIPLSVVAVGALSLLVFAREYLTQELAAVLMVVILLIYLWKKAPTKGGS